MSPTSAREFLLDLAAFLTGLVCAVAAATCAAEPRPWLAAMEIGVAVAGSLAVIALCFLPGTGERIGRRARRAAVCIGGLLLLALAQLLLPRSAGPPLPGLKLSPASLAPTETAREALKIGAGLIGFLLAARLVRRRRRLALLFYPVVAGASLLAFYGLLLHFSGGDLPLPVPRRSWCYADRLNSTYVNPNHFAGLLEMAIPLALALLFLAHPEAVSGPRARTGKRIVNALVRAGTRPARLILLSAVLVMGVALVFTRSKMGIFSAAVSLACLAALRGRSELRTKRAILVLSIAAAVFAASLALDAEPAFREFSVLTEEATNRVALWLDTGRGIAERYWLSGSGLGTYLFTFPEFQTFAPRSEFAEAHCDYLNLFWEAGIAGVALGGGFVLCLVLSILRPGRIVGWPEGARAGAAAAAIAILLHSFADFNLQVPANGLLFCVTAGAVIGLSDKAETTSGMAGGIVDLEPGPAGRG